MYLFNSKGTMTKYATVDDIILEYYKVRLNFYVKRKEHYLKVLENELNILKEKKRFIDLVAVQKKIIINDRTEDDVIVDLQKHNFKELSYNFTEEAIVDLSSLTIPSSRLLNLPNLPEPANCQNQEKFVSSRNTAQIPKGKFIILFSIIVYSY